MNQEKTLTAAVDQALQTAQEHPTKANMNAHKKALKALDDYRAQQERLEPTYKIPALVDFLGEQGFKVGTSTAYEHRDAGKLPIGDDGTITQSAALLYAQQHLKLKSGLDANHDTGLQETKLRKQITQLDFDGKMRELKFRKASGELIERSQVEIELAERATNLKNYLDTVARREVGKICKILGGDPALIPDARAFMLEVNRRALDNYARPIVGVEEE